MNFKEKRILASLINDQEFNPMTATDILDGKARIEDQNTILRDWKKENYVCEWPNFDCTPLLFSFFLPSLSFVRINRMTQHRLSPFPNDVHLEED